MKVYRPLLEAAMAVILVATTFLIVDKVNEQENKALAEKNEQLEKKNQKLRSEKLQLKSQNDYLQTQQSNSLKKDSFSNWSKMEKTAEALVKESDGNFKKTWAFYLVREAKRYDIDPHLVYELLKVETGNTFNPKLVGPETKYGHAYGMSQFMENTAPWVAEMAGLPYEKELLFDPYYSMQLSLVYLDFLYNEYGNWDEALTAYHRGMGGLKQYVSENGHAKSWYAKRIQKKAKSHSTVAMAN